MIKPVHNMTNRPVRLGDLARKRFIRQNWEMFDRECEMVLAIFRETGPKSLVRAADGELKALKHGLGKSDKHWVEWAGRMLADAMGHADCVGLPKENRAPEYIAKEPPSTGDFWGQQIIDTLKLYQIDISGIPQIDAHLFHFSTPLIGQLAAGRKILWITYGSDIIVKNMQDPAFRDYYEFYDITHNISMNLAEGTQGSAFPAHVPPDQAYVDIQRQLDKGEDFDLAFVGGGVVGKFVCHYIKHEIGKSAVDIGALASPLLGRRDRSFFGRKQSRGNFVWDPDRNLLQGRLSQAAR